MENAPAPGAVLSAPTMKPAMIVRTQGDGERIDASPTRIARMMRGVFAKETAIRAWEDQLSSDGRRLVSLRNIAVKSASLLSPC